MIATPQDPRMTMETYLRWEPLQESRYEYVNGAIIAMTGGTVTHNDIAISLLSLLLPSVRPQGCRINMADVKLQIKSCHTFYYPDLMVSCDERDKQATKFIQYPKLVVEVLSPGTAEKDRGDKFTNYQAIETLEEYVLINSEKVSVECYRRGEGRLWLYYPYYQNEILKLESMDIDIPLGQIYLGVDV